MSMYAQTVFRNKEVGRFFFAGTNDDIKLCRHLFACQRRHLGCVRYCRRFLTSLCSVDVELRRSPLQNEDSLNLFCSTSTLFQGSG